MKHSIVIPLLFCGSLFAQAPAEGLKADTVVATVDGRKLTFGELEGYLNALTPQQKAVALANPRELVNQYALQSKVVELAEKDKLDKMSPYKEALEVNRRNLLWDAELAYRSLHLLVTVDDQKKAYESHKDRYTQVTLQEIYLAFVSDDAAKENPKKYRNEAQARALALKLRAEAKTGPDFVRLAKQYSDDEASKAKDGEYGTLKLTDNVPAEIKQLVFALKQDEVSAPVKQQNGFYLFRASKVGLLPYEEVKDDIYNELKDLRLRALLDALQKNILIKVENEAFFKPRDPQKQ